MLELAATIFYALATVVWLAWAIICIGILMKARYRQQRASKHRPDLSNKLIRSLTK